jgi:hypothetical protein
MGEPFFRLAALSFVRAYPPRQRRLSAYGARFPAFLERFGPTRKLPLLSDLARLEWARNESFFAADAPPLDVPSLRDVPQDRYPQLRFTPHPSVRLLASRFRVLDIWEGHRAESGAPREAFVTVNAIPPAADGQQLLVVRPGLELRTTVLSRGELTLLLAVSAGAQLGQAAAAAASIEPGINLQAKLAAHLSLGTFSRFVVSVPERRIKNV